MSSVDSAAISTMMTSLREGILHNLPESSEKAKDVLYSSAITQICCATLKNLPYSLLAREFGVNNIWNFLSSRVTYFEAALISLTSTIHNLFFSVIYTMFVVGTLGFSESFNSDCSRHWIHAVYGVTSTGIGLAGSLISPLLGTWLNLIFIRSIWRSLVQNYRQDVNFFERPLLRKVKSIIKDNRMLIFDIARTKFEESRYKKEFEPSLIYIEKKLDEAQTMDDLVNLIIDIRERFPKMGLSDSTNSRNALQRR